MINSYSTFPLIEYSYFREIVFIVLTHFKNQTAADTLYQHQILICRGAHNCIP